mgnify:FL=1
MSDCEKENKDGCPVEKAFDEACCPVDNSVKMWKNSFFVAMKETQVDILKEKIRKEWGEVMGKEADAILKAMETYWKTALEQAHAQTELRDSIQKIYQSCCK